MNLLRKTVLAAALGAATLTSATPALADRWRGHRGGGDDAAIAIGAGVVGLALGAAIASSNNDRRDYYRDDYYYDRDYPRYREYYYYREVPRYREYYRPYRRGYDRGWNGGYWRGHGHGHGYGRGW